MNLKKIETQIDALIVKARLMVNTRNSTELQDVLDEILDLKTLKKEIADNNL
tara:strand:+ start:932 stop:1087 length:156 start_codon:yes stop_codon:yes gene_type:complete